MYKKKVPDMKVEFLAALSDRSLETNKVLIYSVLIGTETKTIMLYKKSNTKLYNILKNSYKVYQVISVLPQLYQAAERFTTTVRRVLSSLVHC